MKTKIPNRDPLNRKLREFRFIAKGLISTSHPLVAHIIPIRRCNLSCTYCNEYDNYSKGIPLETMMARIDHLAKLGLSSLVFSGGEPLMHKELDEMIAYTRSKGIMPALITNGYLLNVERIKRLNRAGLDYMQISIDNVEPDDVSLKSLKVLDKKLVMLHENATFGVNINSVIGGGIKDPKDALVVGKRAVELGFSTTVGIIHNERGQLRRLNEEEQTIFQQLRDMGKTSYARFNRFQDNLAIGKPNEWRCRAGSRYLYICEDGLVHYCSQRRGYPGTPLLEYTTEDIKREYNTKKVCAPYCTVACVHKVATMDNWRNPQLMPDLSVAKLVKLKSAKRLSEQATDEKAVNASAEQEDLEVVGR
jgi:MoaA/NifB/PqqE/SkfB family radical SAM enzyme